MEDYFEDHSKEELERIKLNNVGSYVKILSICFYILAVLTVVGGLIIGFSSGAIDTAIGFVILGLIVASFLFAIGVFLKMSYDIHYVIIHLPDMISKENK